MDLTQNSQGGYNSPHDSTTPTPMNLAPPIGGRAGGTSPLASPTASQMQRPSLRVVIPQARSPHPDDQVWHCGLVFEGLEVLTLCFWIGDGIEWFWAGIEWFWARMCSCELLVDMWDTEDLECVQLSYCDAAYLLLFFVNVSFII